MSKITDIEAVLIADIKTASSSLKTVVGFDGSYQDEIQKSVNIYPACLVHFDKFEPETRDEQGAIVSYRSRVFLYVGSRNPRSRDARRDGALEILEDLRGALDNKSLIDDDNTTLVHKFYWQGDEHVLSYPNQEIYAQEYLAIIPN